MQLYYCNYCASVFYRTHVVYQCPVCDSYSTLMPMEDAMRALVGPQGANGETVDALHCRVDRLRSEADELNKRLRVLEEMARVVQSPTGGSET